MHKEGDDDDDEPPSPFSLTIKTLIKRSRIIHRVSFSQINLNLYFNLNSSHNLNPDFNLTRFKYNSTCMRPYPANLAFWNTDRLTLWPRVPSSPSKSSCCHSKVWWLLCDPTSSKTISIPHHRTIQHQRIQAISETTHLSTNQSTADRGCCFRRRLRRWCNGRWCVFHRTDGMRKRDQLKGRNKTKKDFQVGIACVGQCLYQSLDDASGSMEISSFSSSLSSSSSLTRKANFSQSHWEQGKSRHFPSSSLQTWHTGLITFQHQQRSQRALLVWTFLFWTHNPSPIQTK